MENTEQKQVSYSLEPSDEGVFLSFERYLKFWPWFVVLGMIGLVLGFAKYKVTPPTYQVETKILVKGESNPLTSSISFDNILGGSSGSNMENQLEILQSFSNYKRTLQNLDWGVTWYYPDKPNDWEMYKFDALEVAFPINGSNIKACKVNISVVNKRAFMVTVDEKVWIKSAERKVVFEEKGEFGKPFKNEFFDFILYNKQELTEGDYYFVINNINHQTKHYLQRVQVEIGNKSSEVIKMKLQGNIPQKEADFLNELNNVFITLGVEEEEKNSELSLNFINDQLSKIKDSLDQSQKEFSDYRKRNNAMDLSQEASFIYKKLEEIESEEFQSNMRLDYYENLERYLGDAQEMQKFSTPSVVGIDDQNLTQMLQKLSELYNRREVLSYSVKEKSPSYILVEREIELTRNDLTENLNSLISNTKTQIAGVVRRKQEIQGRLRKLPDTEKEMIGLQRNFELTNTTYNYMLKKKVEAELSQASTAPKVQIIDGAMPESASFVGPSLMFNLIVGLGLGFMIPFLFIYLMDSFNTTIQNAEDVEKKTTLNVISSIYQSKMKSKLPVLDNPRSGITESFRTLRYHIKTSLHDPEKMIISVNSVMPGEGKSFVSSNLAAILSQMDKKVLLVGADMRKPVLEDIFEHKAKGGLSSILSGEDQLMDVVTSTKADNLSVLHAGPIPSNPTELLENDQFDRFVRDAKTHFDYIIFDNAPVSLVSDGMIVSKYADMSLFITRINKSKRRVINVINKTVETNKLDKVSIVVNGVSLKGYSNAYIKKGYSNYKLAT